MPRTARSTPAGQVYHVLNRSVGRMHLFRNDADFAAFERVILEAHERVPLRILSWCVMSNHWHFVVWPRTDSEVTAFFRWLAHTHAMRWRVAHRTVGYGHLYQGRFKSFPVQRDSHLLSVLRYVERNALSAGLVKRAQDWRWGSLWVRQNREKSLAGLMCDWPVDRPGHWVDWVNEPINAKEMKRLETSLKRGRPFGDDRWVLRTAERLDLTHTMRPEGRPRKNVDVKK